MRLFLSSESLGKYPDVFFKLVGANKKLAFCENAKDDYSPTDRDAKVQEHLTQFGGEGFDIQELDLRKFFGRSEELKSWLSDFGSVWVSGGNTFILRRAMAASGFDKIIKQRLSENSIAYGGSSAGSCVTAPSLRGIEQGDRPHPDTVPDNYPSSEIIWEGLGLVPYMIVPHYGSTWFQKEADATIEYLSKHNIDHKILRDGQVMLVNDDKEEFLK